MEEMDYICKKIDKIALFKFYNFFGLNCSLCTGPSWYRSYFWFTLHLLSQELVKYGLFHAFCPNCTVSSSNRLYKSYHYFHWGMEIQFKYLKWKVFSKFFCFTNANFFSPQTNVMARQLNLERLFQEKIGFDIEETTILKIIYL